MSSSYDETAIEVLTFLAQTRDQLAAFSRNLTWEEERTTPPVVGVTYDMQCRSYQTGLTLEIWLEVDLGGDVVLAWLLDVQPVDNGWLVDGRISRHGRNDEYEVVVDFPELIAPSFLDVQRDVPRTLADLFDAGKKVLSEAQS